MGRHRRSAAGRAATGRATGVTHTQRSLTGGDAPQHSYSGEPWQDAYAGGSRPGPYEGEPWEDSYTGEVRRHAYPGEIVRREQAPRGIAPYLNPEAHRPATGLQPLAYADATARAHAYLFAADGEGPGGPGGGGLTSDGDPSPGHRRRKKGARPVRAGLIGVSAAVALGTAAVASGVVPGLQNYRLGGDTHTTGGERVQAAAAPSNTAAEQGGTSGSAAGRDGGAVTSRTPTRPQSPSRSVSPSASPSTSASRSASPTPTPSKTATAKPTPRATPAGKPQGTPSATASKAPKASAAPMTVSAANAAEAEVLKLVNEERAKVGCSALAANSSLTKLADSFSDDMAARDFFDHTDPDGKTPWDRAAAAGITDLGGENIARGQADAAAVMQAWMNSPGHRANILNCDFKTLGVGVHFGPGGPWWTQDFGY
ncbi:CAP domain-containing protein [Streptomyces sp. NPDC052109]|uniref:CAP domain-containing protein n=1 Tax=Streptomyces sp. NPDC052109 TaxID=3155527 RepID=UPI00341F689C